MRLIIKNHDVYKVTRFVKIYGVFRTLSKIIGRLRPRFKFWLILKFPFYSFKGKTVGIVGSGHHAFSSIAYYLSTSTNCKIVFAMDTDKKASLSLAYAYNAVDMGDSYNIEKINNINPDIVYISSNHASHSKYAIDFLNLGCDVFIEKPIVINNEQLKALSDVIKNTNQNIYVGYNRPHSPSIKIIKDRFIDNGSPFTLSCFISGHLIPEDHWYRNPSEGTRIVSNLGHWLDLSVHILLWSSKFVEYIDITVSYSNISTPSDNIAVSMVSSNNDLINITFTSRGEPFEGVSEMINFNKDDLIVQIDDHRGTKVWDDLFYKKYNHRPKNNGHKLTVLQPFGSVKNREWEEIELSSKLMLHIEKMVTLQETNSRFIL